VSTVAARLVSAMNPKALKGTAEYKKLRRSAWISLLRLQSLSMIKKWNMLGFKEAEIIREVDLIMAEDAKKAQEPRSNLRVKQGNQPSGGGETFDEGDNYIPLQNYLTLPSEKTDWNKLSEDLRKEMRDAAHP
jgi:hypothetical protein